MKRIFAFALALALMLSLCACGGGTSTDTGTDSAQTVDIAVGPADAEQLEWWNGDWYGWWGGGKTTEEYSHMDNAWDCCASIELDENGSGTITIWDEDLPRSNCVAKAKVQLADGETDLGALVSTGGWFMDADLEEGEWQIDAAGAEYDNMISISGTIWDEEGGSYEYHVVLRPWGQTWDEVEEDLLPEHYTDWYLPLVEAGESAPDTLIY